MGAPSTISTPAVHGQRSTAKSTQDTKTAAVKQPAPATATAADGKPIPRHVTTTSGAEDEATA
ncbi:hypothetical protein [Arthrobacter sp. M2012083]|uniref:hypothetical protein n=1 Tax=Arthrobacter sp. M2012083 TaxID=1197706 RepID=UPI0002D78AB9|nr:hypothetical protein [Arthrobacter sp. M2012083]